jgi:hypothetical protein
MTWLAPWLQLEDFVASFVAALFLSIAQQVPRGGGVAEGRRDARGRELLLDYIVLRYARLWRSGLLLLIGGFLLQLVGYSIVTVGVGGHR